MSHNAGADLAGLGSDRWKAYVVLPSNDHITADVCGRLQNGTSIIGSTRAKVSKQNVSRKTATYDSVRR